MPLHRPTTLWRDHYNPLRGLTMTRVVAMEDAAERGQFADLQWFWHFMERTDVTVQSALARRLAFVDSIDWEIRVTEGADPTLAQEQADLLRYAYNRIDNLKEATLFLARALFRGYSHVEKIRAGYGSLVSRLEPVEQWFWVKPDRRGDWRLNPESRPHEAKGEYVQPSTLCVMEAPALNRAIARHFFSKQLAFADWDTALETGANQSIFIMGPPGVTPDKELEYRSVAEQIASNGRGYLPNGSDVKTLDLASRSQLPFFERIKYCDEQIVMAATGGLLTMLTQSGAGTLAGNAHADSLLALARSDAARLTEVYQRSLDREWLNDFFPRQPHVAYFAFDMPQQEDTAKLLESVGNLSWAGYRVDKAQLEEKTGLRLIEVEQPQ
jgi:phage gp29-like protein